MNFPGGKTIPRDDIETQRSNVNEMWLVFILCGTYVGEINVILKPPKLIYYLLLPLKQWSICLFYFITIPEAVIVLMRSRDLNQL